MTIADGYRTSAISLVHRQFGFAGSKVIRRHLSELLKVYPEFDPSRSYPLSWFVFRITGVAAADESVEDLVISGTDLLADAGLLIDRLASRLGPETFEPDLDITAEEVARRLGVSRRTVQRWRPAGLPMRLARFPNGGARSVCRVLILDAFIARNEERIEKARRSSEHRTRRSTREIREGSTGRPDSDGGDSVIATPLGRQRPSRSRSDRARVARLIGRGERWRIPLVDLQMHVDRSRAVVRRLALQARVDHLGVIESPVFVPPNLDRPDAAEVFGVAGLLDAKADERSRLSLADALEVIRHSLGQEDEEIIRARIAAMHFSRARAHEGLTQIASRSGPIREHDIDRVESDLRWWGMLLERATISGLGSGVQRFEQSIGRRIEQLPAKRVNDAIELVIDGVADAVQAFDPTRRTRGHSLDRSVGLTVSRSVARSSAWSEITGARRRVMPDSIGSVTTLRCVPEPVRSLLAPVRWWRMLEMDARAEIEARPGFEAFSIRFGLQVPGRPRSMLETGRVIGVPSPRWSKDVHGVARELRRCAVSSLRSPATRE
jgi:hypothetical protein